MFSNMFWAMLGRSLWIRKSRVAVALLALVAVATLASAQGNLWESSVGQARGELRKYGANLLVLPKDATWLSQLGLQGADRGTGLDQVQMAKLSAALEGAPAATIVPSTFAVASAADANVVVQGTDLAGIRSLNPWWQVEGVWPTSVASGQAIVGSDVAALLGLAPGSILTLRVAPSIGVPTPSSERVGRERSAAFTVAGVISTGTSEDSQVLLDLGAAQRLAGREGVDLVQLSVVADKAALEKLAREIEAASPGAEARVVGQMVKAEVAVLDKIRLLLAVVALAVALAAAIAVFCTLAAAVLERTPEIGLMRSLGASTRYIAALFAAEAIAMALVGAAAGYPLGVGLAQLVGMNVFGSSVGLSPLALPGAVVAAVAVSLGAAVLPVRRAVSIQPGLAMRND